MLSKRKRIDYISHDLVINELRRVAALYNGAYFKKRDFDVNSLTCKSSKVLSIFGSWSIALASIGVDSAPIRELRKDRFEDAELLSELNRITIALGHRPSKSEWEAIDAKFSYTTIKERFHGWLNACLKSEELFADNRVVNNDNVNSNSFKTVVRAKAKENNRNIPLKVRLKVLQRDSYKCVLCGRSPASDSSVELHLDHIIPFSHGGKSEFNNLRTLCRECNIGRGNDLSL